MENSVDANEYTALQLREWLTKLGLPTNGVKNTLVSRLNTIPVEERGECPSVIIEDGNSEADNNIEKDNLSKEIELLRRERDLLARENELLKRTAEFERNHLAACPTESVASEQQRNINTTSFNIIREFLPEYDGVNNFELWATQLRSVADAYNIDSNMLRALLISKLKGKALVWLQSKPCYAIESADSLLDQMKELFGTKEGKLLLRRNFESRKWKYGETFIDYYNDKIILANQLKVDDDELIDCLIDGIPDVQLRTQALMQNFTNKLQLQHAFSKIELVRPVNMSAKLVRSKDNIRCFNCNSFGHYAAECKKPKRELGTCYGCGSSQHRVAACPKRKDAVHFVQENDYNAS